MVAVSMEQHFQIDVNGVQSSEEKGIGLFATTTIIIDTLVGVGVLDLPLVFEWCGGIAFGIMLNIIIFIPMLIGMLAICEVAILVNARTMEDALLKVAGRGWCIYGSFTIFIFSYIICVTYQVFIGDVLGRIFYYSFGEDYCKIWYISDYFLTPLICVVIIAPMTYSKTLHYLKYPSPLFLIVIAAIIAIVAYFAIQHQMEEVKLDWAPDEPFGIIKAIPSYCLAYHAHTQLVPILRCMKNLTIHRGYQACYIALFLCFVVYSIIGTLGYLSKETGSTRDILSNYPHNAYVITVSLMLAAKVTTMYPITAFCGREAVLDFYQEVMRLDGRKNRTRKHYIITTLWLICTTLGALFMPFTPITSDILGFLGALFTFTFPGVCLYQYTLSEGGPKKNKYKATLLNIAGSLLGGITFMTAVWNAAFSTETDGVENACYK